MLVKEMIEWLKTQDQEAIIEVVCHESGTGYYDQGGSASVVEFDPDLNKYGVPVYWEYTDFRGNQFVEEGSAHFNKRYLLLGCKDQ